MVGYPADVRQVILGPDGVLAGCKPGDIIDMTTSEPSLAVEIAAAAASAGVCASTPPSPAATSAPQARLSSMLGGDAEAIRHCGPCWQAMGKTFVRQGGPGAVSTPRWSTRF